MFSRFLGLKPFWPGLRGKLTLFAQNRFPLLNPVKVSLPLGLSIPKGKKDRLFSMGSFLLKMTVIPFSSFKSGFIKLLMKRGGFFSQPSRLGLTSLTTSVVLSLVLIPNFQKVQGEQNLSSLLQSSVTVSSEAGDGLVNQNPADTQKATGTPVDDIINYTVASGDNLWSIGKKFSVSPESLAYVNNISGQDFLSPGQTIKIPPVEGLVHTVKSGETVSAIANKYSVDPQSLVDANYLDAPYSLAVGQSLIVPNATIPQAPAPRPAPVLADSGSRGGLELSASSGNGVVGKLSFPTQGVITQYFSAYHPAIDIANPSSPDVHAAETGVVTFAGWWAGGGGNSVWINHGNGLVTKYCHLNKIYVSVGQKLGRGESLGQMGQTGRAYGIHTHFIVEENGRAINPLSVL